jgi:hypothetical protein
MLLPGGKSHPYEKDDRLCIDHAISYLPAYFSDSIVYYPVTCSGSVF